MNRIYFVLLIFFSIAIALQANISQYYTFSETVGAYIAITGTTITEIQTDDALSGTIPIGFPFEYGPTAYTEVKVSSNGWVSLGNLAADYNLTNELASATTYPILAPLWDDLSLASGNCQYLTTGTAPNRIFTIQYQNAHWNYAQSNQFNFQVILHENGNIEFAYGSTSGNPSSDGASIGININPGGSGNFFSITPGTPSTSSSTVENSSVLTFPGDPVRYLFSAVPAPPNDLGAVSLTGNTTPSQGTASTYVLTIRNNGTAPQNTYQVQLLADGNLMTSLPGTLIGPGAVQTYDLIWTPPITGVVNLTGNIILNGDAYIENNVTLPLRVIVQPPGTTAVTVGDGGELALMPIDMYYHNSLYETIYQAGEIPFSGMINSIGFYNNFITDLPGKPTKMWLGLTEQTDLSTGWIPATQLVQVFDGFVDYPAGTNFIVIPLSVPVAYGGGNLVMMANRPMDTTYFDFNDRFECQTVGSNRSLLVYSDFENYDANTPPTGSGELSGQFPKTTFFFTATSINPQFGITPSSKNFGQVLMNTTHDQVFRTFNSGGGTLTLSSITISGSPYFTLQNLPTLPVNLSTGQLANFTVRYAPLLPGNHTATVTVTDNLARIQHQISISGNSIDPTIYTSPYFQNFDTVAVPNLPADWSSLVAPVTPGSLVGTINSEYFSSPNCAQLYSEWPMTAGIYLFAPPLSPTLNINAMRVKFRAKGENGSTLLVGVTSSTSDPADFTVLSTVALNTTWQELVVNLSDYTGTGRYIAFKHGNTSWYPAVIIDDVTIETTPQNDLAANAVTGNQVPTAGNPTIYTASIFNWGTLVQTNYTVKLYDAANVELASVFGPTVASNETATVNLTWTPLVAGVTNIHAKVVLAGDQNPANDDSPALQVIVQATGTTALTIGAGDQNAQFPINMFWHNSLYETIYQAEDIPAVGLITSIAFYNNFVTNLPNKPTKIWLAMTQQEDLSTGWIPATEMVLVFDGTVNYPSGNNTIMIPLITPFPYNGGNLALMANRPMDTQYFSSLDYFYCQTGELNCSLEIHDDMVNFDPENPPANAELSSLFPKTTMFFVPVGTTPFFGVAPHARDFGTVLLNNTRQQVFTIFNSGGGPLTINSIAMSGSPVFSLSGLPTLPRTLNSGQNVTFTCTYTPTAAGTQNGTITITDNLTRSRTAHPVNLTGTCIDPIIYASPYFQDFDDLPAPALPLDWQTLYTPIPAMGYIQTQTWSPYSTPNSVELYNSENGTGDILLIAPPLTDSISVPAMRVRFWARGNDAYPVEVGIMSASDNASTFQMVSTLTLTQNWAEYIVSFETYTGTGKYITFRHGMGGLYRSIYLDDVMIETTPHNDLAALNVTGNSTPSVGSISNYTVNLYNWGSNPQTTYTVKLFQEGGTEIATAAGVAVAPNSPTQVSLSWMPAQQGDVAIYAKVFLATDQNNLNDQTPNLITHVQPAGIFVVTIGEGTEEAQMPVSMYYLNSLFETVYPSSELNFIGMVTGIAFYNNFSTTEIAKPTNIWLGTTTQTELGGGWIPSTNLTQVFAGNVDYPSGQNLISITLDTPFLYITGNLVIMVQRPIDSQTGDWQDYFHCQTIGTTRSRLAYSDFDTYDPAAPPEGDFLTGQYPQTSLFIIPGGVGTLTGTVTNSSSQPMAGVAIHLQNGAQTVTNAAGHYTIQNIVAGSYQVTASFHGYTSQVANVIIEEDSTLVHNFTMPLMPTVTVTGRLVGSDAPAVGLAGAAITLAGYENYATTANALGYFTFPTVYAGQTYSYIAGAEGYQNLTGNANVGTGNLNMGTLTLNEAAYTPRNMQATLSTDQHTVALAWQEPDPNTVDVNQSFEDPVFPPANWVHTQNNNGPANSNGVFPTWSRLGTVLDGSYTVTPPDGEWQSGMCLAFSHQDEWLITPMFICPQGANLEFMTFAYYGSPYGDHYYVKISTDNGMNWTPLWDASALTGGWNQYQTPVTINLASYTGQQVKLAWHADDPNASSDGMWFSWFIDNIEVSNNARSIRFPASELTFRSALEKGQASKPLIKDKPTLTSEKERSINGRVADLPSIPASTPRHRSLQGYQIWRLVSGQEQNEVTWTLLTPNMITGLNYTDAAWPTVPAGTYKWAVKAVYTNNVLSLAAFSNAVVRPPYATGTLQGVVRNVANQPIPGATITAGAYIITTSSSGVYNQVMATGVYSVSCSAPGYTTQTIPNVVITEGQTTTLNFSMPVPNTDEVEVKTTALLANYPNPFNPQTTIRFDVKGTKPVRVDIYNTKGQLIRTLVNEKKNTGHYDCLWNGRDNNGKAVASGVYYYRMEAGSYRSQHLMLMLK